MNNDVNEYLRRVKVSPSKLSKLEFLFRLHHAHFYSIPFENIDMKRNALESISTQDVMKRIIYSNRGGMCFELSILIKFVFKHFGYNYGIRLGRVLTPKITPATHQFFIVNIDGDKWIFDVGYGAKGPRSLLKLSDGYLHEHPFLSSRVERHNEHGWIVSIKENSQPNANWENIYSFHDIEVLKQDVEMAYFYILHSSNSLLNKNVVVSLPKEMGRISIRNNVFTEVKGHCASNINITNKHMMSDLLFERFGIDIPSSLLTN
ncbi:arylamine N-acetyltransferase [Providencia huaxiensis]|uniref:Arylamine N-acetyltransferase n=1 Tax=Providencia huaxiensis TaxID=2027290 RepID=A0ABU2ITS0_9GAMM|nr:MULTISPECIES: arylamine N-acetyltransferase [Providencia]AXH63248.1 arylamine N-acetyltransferase [Providencia huaxiensis]MBZ3680907.1 arylamine N-acetyltransferase [Providencia rettgeri]MDT0131945.1 arylamine N-acetyltransferase [Providencia huaxiensis]MDT1978351.1 arylamine N-acetyltransferase [Providencia huaxiensis]QLR01491.1 arylamine N-acetyltransferase [Providencia rettgeri]